MADRDDEDEDALTWAGDADRGRGPDLLARSRRGAGADAAADDAAGLDEPEGADAELEADDGAGTAIARRPLTLLGRAVIAIAGIGFAAWTVLWFIGSRYNALTYASGDLFLDAMFAFGKFIAIVAAPIWFVAVLTILRDRGDGIRALWFAIGLVLLLPWPYLLLSGNA